MGTTRTNVPLEELPVNQRGALDRFKAPFTPPIKFVDTSIHPWMNRRPDYYLFIFNTVNREFNVTRGNFFPNIKIKSCPAGDSYIMAMKIPNIMNYMDASPETNESLVRSEYGERFATDVINPQNLSTDVWASPPPDQRWIDGGSDDLSIRGVFWTKGVCVSCRKPQRTTPGFDAENKPTDMCAECGKPFVAAPTEDELRKCKGRLEQFYQSMIDRANRIASDPRSPREDITPECHFAADYFRLSPPWHQFMQTPAFCTNCGEQIREGIAFHTSMATGTLCVIDWKKTVNAGVKKKEDVPEDLRWWTDEPTSEPKGRGKN